MDHTKNSKNKSNTLQSAVVSVIVGRSYHAGVCWSGLISSG